MMETLGDFITEVLVTPYIIPKLNQLFFKAYLRTVHVNLEKFC